MQVYKWKLWNRRAFLIALVIPLIIMTLLGMIRTAVVEAFNGMISTFYHISDVYRELWKRNEPVNAEPDELKNEDFWGNC